MKTYKYYEKPIEVHGVPFWDENHKMERIPDKYIDSFPLLKFFGKRCPGARVCFRTDSEKFTVRIKLSTISADSGMSLYSAQSINVMIGDRKYAHFAGLVVPDNYQTKTAEKTFVKSPKEEDITLYLPRNEFIDDIEIEIEDNATISAPTPYKYGPVLYYGSSITEGACCCRLTNVYSALISAELDVDYYNYGFSGSARGEIEMADLINEIPITAFVMDYDYNAPDVEHLEKTHEPFFKQIRKKQPDLPIIFITAPRYFQKDDFDRRAEIIKRTYQNAVNSGDKNVWYVDGRNFFGNEGSLCSCDNIHPNDLGFYYMAKAIKPVIKEALKITCDD